MVPLSRVERVMSAPVLAAAGPYDPLIGMAIVFAIIGLLVVVVVGDLYYALKNGRRWISQSISDHFELWCRLHPLSAALLAMVVGALVSHFFWSTGHPGPWPLPWP
jgi:H+/Cl- antiporter ClcA